MRAGCPSEKAWWANLKWKDEAGNLRYGKRLLAVDEISFWGRASRLVF
jgi:hypothetical protein